MGRMKEPASGGRLKIEHMGATDSQLAHLKIESMQNAMLRQQDAVAYKIQAASERTKGRELVSTIHGFKEYWRNRPPEGKRSRMEPYESYDLGMCEEELKVVKQRAQEFETKAAEFQAEAERHARETAELDERLRKLQREGKSREAEEILPNGPED